MIVETQLTKKDFINANFEIFWGKIFIKIYTIMLSTVFIVGIISFFAKGSSITTSISPLLILVIFSFIVYASASKNFKTNKRISEKINYNFEYDNLTITGESFNTVLSWDKVYKVSITKHWLFIWHNTQNANPISKNYFNHNQLAALKTILDTHKVKNNL